VVGLEGAEQVDERKVFDLAQKSFVAPRELLEPIALAPLQQRAGVRHDLLNVDGLRQKIVRARFDAPDLRLDGALAEKDERDRGTLRPLFYVAAELESVRTALEPRLGDDQIRARAPHGGRGLGRRRGGSHVEAGVPEAELEEPPDLRVTVDDEYSASSRLLIRSRFHGARDARRPGTSISGPPGGRNETKCYGANARIHS